MLTSDELTEIQKEIMLGLAWGDPRSKVKQDDEHHATWDAIAGELGGIAAAGLQPDLVHEVDVDQPAP